MTNKNENFRIRITLENVIEDKDITLFTFSKIAIGIEKLKKSISDCFNSLQKFVKEDIEDKQTPSNLIDI